MTKEDSPTTGAATSSNTQTTTPSSNSTSNTSNQSHNSVQSSGPTHSSPEDESAELTENQPRKRSKVSRACDACRRKKIKCNAEYSSALQKVTKICNNCVKNNEVCAFSRVPLKRGPSKGYIRDLEEKLDSKAVHIHPQSPLQQPHQSQVYQAYQYPNYYVQTQQNLQNLQNANVQRLGLPPRPLPLNSHSPTAPPVNVSNVPPTPNAPNIMAAQPLPFPQKHPSPIILPPLGELHSKILPPQKFSTSPIEGSNGSNVSHNSHPSTNSSVPSSPKSNSITGLLNAETSKNSSPPIQGPFWKVPYEMPAGPSRRSSITLLGGSLGNGTSRRKSSVDSISSTSTTGTRLSSLRTTGDLASDSDNDDFYSVRSNNSSVVSVSAHAGGTRSSSANIAHSRQSSQANSPRASISSLSSLSGRINKNLHIQPQPQPHYYPQHLSPGVPPLTTNIQIYYARFHSNFPILPFDESLLLSYLDKDDHAILDIFNHALYNLISFNNINLADTATLMMKIVSLCPLKKPDYFPRPSTLIFFFSSLILMNYSILLSGEAYSLGISTAISIFNEFKVLERFMAEPPITPPLSQIDNIKFYIPKLYFLNCIIDDLYALSFGQQKLVNHNELIEALKSNFKYLVPQNALTSTISLHLNQLVETRNSYLFPNKTPKEVGFKDLIPQNNIDEFSNHFINLVKEKYDLITYVFEVNSYLSVQSSSKFDIEEVFENIGDYNSKLIRLMKKLSTSIVNFANYISTAYSSTSTESIDTNRSTHSRALSQSPGSVSANIQVNPLLNITIGQLFKLIKLNKLIIDSLINLFRSTNSTVQASSHNDDLLNRCIRINHDLSISFNLLNLNLVNLQIGNAAVATIRNNLNSYQLNFNTNTTERSNGETKFSECLDQWRKDFKQVVGFIEAESTEGWY